MSRHGARLDAADKQWHLTSPTPYDPPLTYGGWRQSHALGARIASILHQRENEANSQPLNGLLQHPSIATLDANDHTDDGHQAPDRREAGGRKHRIILHTSPFLRCVQTAIAVSAGISEAHEGLNTTKSHAAHPAHPAHPMHSGSPHIRAMEHWNSPQLSAISEPEEFDEGQSRTSRITTGQASKPLLRTDAFLGEWLSPGYFEDITHPPDSVMMVAGAKANLLREKHHAIEIEGGGSKKAAVGNFPGGWGGRTIDANANANSDDDGPLARLSGLNRSLPRLNRSSSHSSAGTLAHRSMNKPQGEIENATSSKDGGYASPTPSYAISPLAPIPPGYVAYAKDTCVDVDYQWDSMRPPHEWGNGGQYDEEWSSMHKRLRHGLQQMIFWYGQLDSRRLAPVGEEPAELARLDEEDEDDTDIVLILVTHSAGCNALMGALTNQPVLLDAGMASLTMAVRKPEAEETCLHPLVPISSGFRRRRSSIDLGLSELFEVKIMASTDHLRAGSVTSSHRSASASISHNSPRYRSASPASTSSSYSAADGGSFSDMNGSHAVGGGMHRSSSAAIPRSNGLWSKPTGTTPTGLWGSPVTTPSEATFEQRPARDKSPLRESTTLKQNEREEEEADTLQSTQLKENNRPESGGLWGVPPTTPPSDREKGPKRRWTHSEHR